MIKLRPHHLVCIPRYFSKGGYNKNYKKNLKKICFKIRKNSNAKIKITKKCDDICKECPYKINNRCKKREGINKIIITQDNRILKELKIKENSVYKAKDVFNLSINKIKDKDLKKFCKIRIGCEFLPLCSKFGLNKSFIKDLNQK